MVGFNFNPASLSELKPHMLGMFIDVRTIYDEVVEIYLYCFPLETMQ